MKKTLLTLVLIFSLNCFSQNPDPNLFQTWYLSSLQTSDASILHIISEINPKITPSLTISPNMQISGHGSCNSFTGILNINNTGQLQFDQFASTLALCPEHANSSFESAYFYLFQIGKFYKISSIEGGMKLEIQTPIFGNSVFYNFNLSSKGFETEVTRLSPNPCGSKIALNSKLAVNKVEIYNSQGQNCKTVLKNFEEIDLSELESGTYIFKIHDENGTVNKKIIKE